MSLFRGTNPNGVKLRAISAPWPQKPLDDDPEFLVQIQFRNGTRITKRIHAQHAAQAIQRALTGLISGESQDVHRAIVTEI